MVNKNIVILSTSYWDSPLKFRRHYFASLASQQGYKVIYVNPTFTILSFFQDKDSRLSYFEFFKGIRKLNANLSILTMPPLFPFQKKFHWINCLNSWITGLILRRAVKKYFSSKYALLAYQPEDNFRIPKSHNSVLVYDCVDDHCEYPWNVKFKTDIEKLEKMLISRADLLSVSSSYLLDKKKHLSKRSILIPNGVNFDLFNKALNPETLCPEDIKDIKNPIIIYIGAISEWFDVELVKKIAGHNSHWSVVLIGPQSLSKRVFLKHINIHCLGTKKQHEVPAYLKKADVAIIPFIVNDLIKSVNPLKLYEYLAAGKSVVSTALPDVLKFEKDLMVYIGRTNEEFITHIEHCILHSKENIQEKVAVAKQYSWEHIYEMLFHEIEKLAEIKGI